MSSTSEAGILEVREGVRANFCDIATITWNSGTLRRICFSSSSLRLYHWPLSAFSSSASSTPLNALQTVSYLMSILTKARAVQCTTRGSLNDRIPFERYSLENAEGMIFSMIALRGGGVGRYDVGMGVVEVEGVFEFQVAKLFIGIGREMMEPRNATFVIQRDDNRGSNEMLAVDQ